MKGSVWQLPDGQWRIRWRTSNGRRPSETYRLKEQAERALRRHIDAAEAGGDRVDRRQTLTDVLGEWEAATKRAVKPRTWDAYDQHVRTWIKPRLGSQRLSMIDKVTVQRFVSGLTTAGLAPKTVRGVHSTLTLILRHSGVAPVEVRLPRVERVEIRIPTPAEIEQLAGTIDARMWAMVRLCGYAGVRQGEALAMRPGDVDWLHRRIRVSGTLNLRSQRRESPKNGRGRWVTMPSVVADTLSRHVAEYPPSEYLFHRRDGRPWKASRVWEAWNEAREACKLEEIDFHHLRHAAASLMIQSGWSAKRVQVELGHADPAFTLRVYGHLFPEEIDTGRAQMDALLARTLGPHTDDEQASGGAVPLQ